MIAYHESFQQRPGMGGVVRRLEGAGGVPAPELRQGLEAARMRLGPFRQVVTMAMNGQDNVYFRF